MLQVSHTVTSRPHLLEHFIRSQFADVLANPDEYDRDERAAALRHVELLALLRHENPAQTLADIRED